jgi:hypothetical protein
MKYERGFKMISGFDNKIINIFDISVGYLHCLEVNSVFNVSEAYSANRSKGGPIKNEVV